jgi:hypothetical protein
MLCVCGSLRALQRAAAVRRCCTHRRVATAAAQHDVPPLRLLCRHGDLIFFDKPAGMMVHPHSHQAAGAQVCLAALRIR